MTPLNKTCTQAKLVWRSHRQSGRHSTNESRSAKALYAGRRQGPEVSEHDALKWITLNPAWALGIDDKLGSITIGKAADVVIWDRSPLSVYAKATHVFIDGREVLKRYQGTQWSDFEVKP